MAALGQWCPGLQLRTLAAPTTRSSHPSASPPRICVYVVALHSNSGDGWEVDDQFSMFYAYLGSKTQCRRLGTRT